jgi:hypothetical protein
MTPTANEMLRALGSGVRPAAAGAAAGTGKTGTRAAIEESGFADLLQSARSGEISSTRRVTVDLAAGVSLTDEELSQLAAAADKAEAAGIRRALVFVGDKPLVLDVQTRSVVGKAELSYGCVTGIDGAVRVGGNQGTQDAQVLPVPWTMRPEQELRKAG